MTTWMDDPLQPVYHTPREGYIPCTTAASPPLTLLPPHIDHDVTSFLGIDLNIGQPQPHYNVSAVQYHGLFSQDTMSSYNADVET